MGHRRNDVDNYYKEAYPEKMRDKAQLKVIKI
jgi:23S rRNA U2552 (ribose-2'-O)-methylase RlmE/FtsJ